MRFPIFKQLDAMDCGPTCLRMIAKYYGKSVPLEFLREKSEFGREGVSMLGLADTAEEIGFKAVGLKLSFEQLISEAPLPCILHWSQYHFVVLTPESKKNKLVIADPEKGLIKISKEDFLSNWISVTDQDEKKGIALLLERNIDFNETSFPEERTNKSIGWKYLFSFLRLNKKYLFQIAIGLLIGSLLQLVFPFLTQSIVDTGINSQDINFIQLVLAAQLVLLFSQTIVDFLRSRLLLYISTKINVTILSAFWSKLMKLPMHFFDSKHPGDIMQRKDDNQRIESFLTGSALSTLFSILNLIIFLIVLLNYNISVFFIFLSGTILYVIWIQLFLRYRRQFDYQRFSVAAKETSATMQLIYGIQEIKLNNAENTFRWAWENIQGKLFRINFSTLSLNQIQQTGAFFINQGKNILITFIVAKLVIEGQMTLGMMLAIQYIIGQMNSPVEQLIGFTQQAQDAKISLERLNDIHVLEDEEPPNKQFVHSILQEQGISIRNLSFTYSGAGNEPVLNDVNLDIPQGKVTAIVGMSGSGKTTLLKILLGFYTHYKGEIFIGSTNMKLISPKFWRSLVGAVMQDSYIFNDNIRKNITITNDRIDNDRLIKASQTANILEYIQSLPLGFNTKIGSEGKGVSGGQKQRISIARAVYKDPKFIFFDEATNSLDANNERIIMDNLNDFFKGRTVVVVAHRLSTVRNADNIVVFENGKIIEEGTHDNLAKKGGKYFELVKNQLELGK